MTAFVCSFAGTNVGVRALFDETKEFCREYLTDGAPAFVIETTQDDVVIVADPYDTTDHNQDGYGVYGAERFLYNFTFYNFFEGEELNDMCFLVAVPNE